MPAPTSTVARLAAFFKTVYVERADAMQNMAIRDYPLLRMMTKIDDLDGNNLYIPLNTNLPVGASASFANSQTNKQGSKGYAWTLTRNTMYHFVNISGEAIHASRRDPAAFIRAREKETREAVDYVMQRLGDIVWNDGAADLGQVGGASPLSAVTYTFVLKDTSKSINFYEGQVLVANTVRNGAGTPRTDVPTVTKVNHFTGVVTATSSMSSGTGDIAQNDYLFVQGDRDQVANVLQTGHGIAAYLPASDPGVGGVPIALNGVADRSILPNALAGWRSTWEGSIEESVKRLCATMLRHTNAKATNYFLSFDNFHRLEMEMGARAIRDVGMPAKFGFPTIGIQTAKGMIPCVADPYAPNDTGFLLDMSTWECHTLEGLPHVIDDDGRGILRDGDADGVEIRFRAWYEFCCTRPFANGRHPIV